MSNATCAACGERILKRDRFVIAGTEVFHPQCISDIPRSKMHRLASRTREIMADKDRLRFELEAMRETLRRAQEADRSHQAAAKVAVEWERSMYQDAQAALMATRAERDRVERERGQLAAALQSARAELALLKAMGPNVRTDLAADEKQDTRDPLEVRASLLELE